MLRTKNLLTAPKTVISLLCLLLFACLAGALIPQSASTSPAYFAAWQAKSPYSYYLVRSLQLTRVFTSYWFLLLIFLLLPAISISVYGQFRKALLAFNAKPAFKYIPQAVFNTAHFSAAALREKFAKRGFQAEECQGEKASLFIFSKNRRNVWGNFIFHGGILVLIMASLLTFACQKRGFVQLIEGDTFSGKEEDFLTTERGIFSGRFKPPFEIYLEKLSHSYWDTGELKEVRSDAIIYRQGMPLKTILVRGKPFTIDGVTIYQSAHFGYTLKILLLTEEKGKTTIPTYFSLDMAPAGKPLKGKGDFPTTDYILDMTFFPDLDGRSPHLINPLLQVRFMKGEKEAGRAALKPGEEAVVEDSRFRFEEVRSWSGLRLTENRFMPLVYAGFLMNMAGIFMMFLFTPQEICIAVTEGEDGDFNIAMAVKTRTGGKILLADAREIVKESLGSRIVTG